MPIWNLVASVYLAAALTLPHRVWSSQTDHVTHLTASDTAPQLAVPNDNRSPAGTLRGEVLEVHLEIRWARWRPDPDVDSSVTVLAFAEEGGPATIPGPLLRVPEGTEVHVTIRSKITDSIRVGLPAPRHRGPTTSEMAEPTLIVHGIRAGTVPDDTLHVGPGAVRDVRYRAGTPGTYMYWAGTVERPLRIRTGRDAQLTGAIVIDPAGVTSDADERVFVITGIDILPDSARPPPREDIFELAINGLSWPHTERLRYGVGDTVRWRWVNGSEVAHPMHLHGFHFRTLARGNGVRDTTFARDAAPLAVTELVQPGGTVRMEWVPTRAGNWLMHCHLIGHIVPFPERAAEQRARGAHDVTDHPLRAMAGLVLGITVSAPASAAETTPKRPLRLFAQERRVRGDSAVARGFALQEGAEPAPDSIVVPGPPLILTRGETTAITAINRLAEPTTVHWHGMELESVYDGVAGWSRTGSSVAPLIAPGDSFVVVITPPRSGTFIYHTHMDETEQLKRGMYGPLLVLEPDESFDQEVDRVFVIGEAVDTTVSGLVVNGRREPAPVTMRAGVRHRLRLINISPDATVEITLLEDSLPLRWGPIAKDGADLPPALQVETSAYVRMSAGETYDFAWTPVASVHANLLVKWAFPTEPGHLLLRQPIVIH